MQEYLVEKELLSVEVDQSLVEKNFVVDKFPTQEVSRPEHPIIIQMDNEDTIIEDLENDQLMSDKAITFMTAKKWFKLFLLH